MDEYSSFDTAVEIIAYKIADCVKKSKNNKEYEKELEKLRRERNEMYNGDKKTIEKIIRVYGKELKKEYNSAAN